MPPLIPPCARCHHSKYEHGSKCRHVAQGDVLGCDCPGYLAEPIPAPTAPRETAWVTGCDAPACPGCGSILVLAYRCDCCGAVYRRESHHERPRQPAAKAAVEITPLVKADLDARTELGKRKYGGPLVAGEGRDALRDLYEELLDAAQYCRKLLAERDGR